MPGVPETVHATAIAAGGRGVLIRGPSGSGKSDLALRCLALPESQLIPQCAQLISDDRVTLTAAPDQLLARAPAAIRGKLEVRGLGIINVSDVADDVPIVLIADLVPAREVERMPDPLENTVILGFRVPVLKFSAFESSAAIKLMTALTNPTLAKVRLLR